jgi:hypothetical protein
VTNSRCYSIVDVVRETGSTTVLAPPSARVPAHSELAFARLLGLGAGQGSGAHPVRDGVVFGLMLSLALALAMMTLGAVL